MILGLEGEAVRADKFMRLLLIVSFERAFVFSCGFVSASRTDSMCLTFSTSSMRYIFSNSHSCSKISESPRG